MGGFLSMGGLSCTISLNFVVIVPGTPCRLRLDHQLESLLYQGCRGDIAL